MWRKLLISDKRYAGDNRLIIHRYYQGIVWHLDVGSSSWSLRHSKGLVVHQLKCTWAGSRTCETVRSLSTIVQKNLGFTLVRKDGAEYISCSRLFFTSMAGCYIFSKEGWKHISGNLLKIFFCNCIDQCLVG